MDVLEGNKTELIQLACMQVTAARLLPTLVSGPALVLRLCLSRPLSVLQRALRVGACFNWVAQNVRKPYGVRIRLTSYFDRIQVTFPRKGSLVETRASAGR